MTPTHSTVARPVFVIRWVARVLGTALLFLWGAFFLEHLGWFADVRQLPPAWVMFLQFLHGVMLLGFVLAWRWEALGAALVLASAPPFFWMAAGRNFLLFALVTIFPAVLWLYCAWHDWQGSVTVKKPE